MLQPLCRRIVGVDFSTGMLAAARRNLPPSGDASECELVHCDVLDMQFVEEFDVATFLGGNGHILPKDQSQFLNRVWRSLRVGGRFVFVTAPMPSRTSKRYWMSQGFNFGMRLRNWLFRPPFIMYYLMFLLPEVVTLLHICGFEVSIRSGLFPPPFNSFALVVATKQRQN